MRYKISQVNPIARARSESRAASLSECLTVFYEIAEKLDRHVNVITLRPGGGYVRFYELRFTWPDGNPGYATILPCE